jgi:hypothetical protein
VAKAQQAVIVSLSPSTDAIIYGPGRVRIVQGRSSWALSEREMPKLVEAWQEFEKARRPGKASPGSPA